MIIEGYFYVQNLTFNLCGINIKAKKSEVIVKRPSLCLLPLVFAIAHDMAIIHYAYENRHDSAELTDSMAMVCQSLLSIWKLLLFLKNRRKFVEIIKNVHMGNMKAPQKELPIIRTENIKAKIVSTLYFRSCTLTGVFALGTPLFEALYYYCTAGAIVLHVPYKASYFWDYSELGGYSLVYISCCLNLHLLVFMALAVDTTFVWLVGNIVAQFRTLRFRFKELATICREAGIGESNDEILNSFKSCIQYHNQIMNTVKELNNIYGEIIFVKFMISCLQICCLVFRLSRPALSLMAILYQGLFLVCVVLQLMLYCYNGQRISTHSLQVSYDIYLDFEWSCLKQNYKKMLLQTMMRAQNCTELNAVFFVLDLNLFVWAFKTAGSLITALKTFEEGE